MVVDKVADSTIVEIVFYCNKQIDPLFFVSVYNLDKDDNSTKLLFVTCFPIYIYCLSRERVNL